MEYTRRTVHRLAPASFFTIFLIALLFLGQFSANAFTTRLPIRDYSTDKGLINNEVITAFQDSRGYIWFGTYGGLSRFDGKRFKNYDQKDSGLQGSIIRAITEDRNHKVWIGYTGGIAQIDQNLAGDRFTAYSHENGLLGRDIVGLAPDPDGGLWILTEQGINYFNGDTFISKPLPGIDTSLSGTSLQSTPEGYIYVVAQKQLLRITKNDTTLTSHTCPPADFEVQSIRFHPQEHALYLISSDKLYLYKDSLYTFIAVSPLPDDLLNLAVGNDNTLWIISETMLWRSTRDGNTVYSNTMLHQKSLSNLLEDREGNLWLTTWAGVAMIIDTAILNYHDLPVQIVSAVLKDPYNNFWIAGDKGIIKLNPANEILFYNKSAFVEFLFFDDDKIFTGTDSGGLNVLDLRGNLLATYSPDITFTCMIKDSNDKYWLGSYSGLYSFSGKRIDLEIDTKQGLGSNVIWTLLEDGKGRLWVGTENGLSQLVNGKWFHFNTSDGLPHPSIWHLHEDDDWGLLVATSQGIAQVQDNGITGLQQLNNKPIDNLTTDLSGNLWVGTPQGIFKINGAGKIDISLDKARGLPANSTYFRTALIDKNHLYMGTQKGLSRIDLHAQPRRPTQPRLYINKIRVNQKTVGKLPRPFGHDKKNITFFFHAVHMYLPHNVSYSFFLDGMDKGWSEPRSDLMQAAYTNLSPGQYTFKVQAFGVDGVKSAIRSINFTIEQPFWQSGWFLFFEILTGFALVGLLSHLVSERKVRKQEAYARKLEQIVEERTQNLKVARKSAEAANQAKSVFLAGMSHEIRTPLNSVIGITEILLDSQLSKEQRDFTKTLQKSADALLKIIDDILDFSRIEAGVIDLKTELFDLMGTVEDLGQLLAMRADEKNIDLIIRYAPGTPKYFEGDCDRIQQVLLNLAGNAVKFTESGYVLIDIDHREMTDNHAVINFRVEDSGIGIPEKFIRPIFNRFTQTDTGAGRKYGGTGLGLAISSQLVALMGGEIQVESTLGSGSVFEFSLTFPRVQQRKEAHAPGADLSNLRVIVIDDNDINRKVIMERLEFWKISCDQAGSGDEAKQKMVDAAEDDMPFDIALIDHLMPETTGTDVARAIKNHPLVEATLLVLFTTLSSPVDKKVLDQFGIEAHLYKPVHAGQLHSLLRTVSSALEKGEVPTLSTDGPVDYKPANGVRFNADILLVEDIATNQKVATAMLNSFGCKVDSVDNGEDAIQRLATTSYDLVFMDCHLPGIDGFETTHLIRKNELKNSSQTGSNSVEHIPIVALTASASTRDREQCIAAGMDEYLAKPISRQNLLTLLTKALPGNKGQFADRVDRILIACAGRTDSSNITQTCQKLFPGAVIRYSSCGIETCSLIAGFLPDLVFIDDYLDDTDIFALLKYINSHEVYQSIHCLVIVRSPEDDNLIKAIQLVGCTPILKKSLDNNTLEQDLQHHFYTSQITTQPSANHQPVPSSATSMEYNSPATEDSVLDPARLIQTFQGDLDMIRGYIKILVSDMPAVLSDLDANIEANQLEMIEHQAHKVKNMAAEAGTTRLFQLASSMEKAAIEGNSGLCGQQLPLLKNEFDLALKAIRKQGW